MSSNSEEKLLCLIAKAHWNESDQQLAGSLFENSHFSWPFFWELAVFNGTANLATKKLIPLGIDIPEQIKHRVQLVAEQNLKRRKQLLNFVKALHQVKIDVYCLKGFLLGEIVYQDPCYKRMNDIDILIRPNHVHEAVNIALRNGFAFATEAFLGATQIDFRLHHSPPLISTDKGTLIGLHWGLASPFAKRAPNTDIFEASKTFAIDAIPVKRMSYEHNLLHLCIHLPFFKIGLRELADVANLILHAGEEIDWDALFATSKKWRSQDALYRVVTLADCVIPCLNKNVRQKLGELAEIMGKSRYVTDTQKRVSNLSVLLRSRSTYLSKIEKNYILFKLSKRYEDRAFHLKEQWRHALFVPEAERCRLLATSPQDLGSFSSLQASGAICFALVQDLGITLLILISFKNLFSLIRQRILHWLRVGPQINESNNLQSAKQLLETME